MEIDSGETLDTLFGGRLKIHQLKRGYRFSIDSLLLANFVKPHPTERVIDLGTGCGIIPLLLAFRWRVQEIVGVEIQASLADLARRNIGINLLSAKMEIWEKDLKSLGKTPQPEETFDLVLTNPPYRKIGSGRINPRSEKALARHEIQATLEDLLRAASALLKEKGRFSIVYPASRVAELIPEMRRFHLEPKRMQFVHSRPGEPARLILAEAAKEGRTQVLVLSPFFLYDSAGRYTPAAEELFS